MKILIIALLAVTPQEAGIVRVVREVPAGARSTLAGANRAPLAASPLIKLPPGTIVPRGWLRQQLELTRDGMIGHLREISPWLDFARSAWASAGGTGERGWEELPYWLKGFGDLGYVLHDEGIIAETRRWIEAVLASQREDGWFGPRALLTSLDGKPDLWPHMVMLNVLQSYHEWSGDERVLALMTRYFAWQNTLPASAFGEGYWPKLRAGDNIESVHWLYNRTAQASLLELAEKIHRNMARWDEGVIDWHNVNIAQGFRAPAVFSAQDRRAELVAAVERNYLEVMERYGQFPGGGFAGDENCRPGFGDPRQGFETCGIVEFMHSFEMLTRITGAAVWSDRAEELAFNSLPAALTPDHKALHYLTCANQVQLDRTNKAPGIQNGGTMFSYSPLEVYRCCQHNVSHGWPYYAEELWLATADQGLCASLYAACEVQVKLADGTGVQLAEATDYPFADTITIRVGVPHPVSFPLSLRVPGWCEGAAVRVNGKRVDVAAAPRSYIVLSPTWKDGDTVELTLPMKTRVRHWPKNQDAVSVDHGPVTFSLAIEERWQRYGRENTAWPEWEVFPASPWNYGLALDAPLELVRAPGAIAAQPFTPAAAPIRITAKARKIPEWQVDHLGLVGRLQQSPARTDEPLETVTLIPMGAARLRISAFPWVAKDAAASTSAHAWLAPQRPAAPPWQVSASHVWSGDTMEAMADGLSPASSSDQSIPRFTWWDHRGTHEWAQYDFDAPRTVASIAVYWFDDRPSGGCRVPRTWRLMVKRGEDWVPVPGEYPIALDQWNELRFAPPLETRALRLEVELEPGFSGGILEWRIEE